MERRKTKAVNVGNIVIGNGNPIAVQTMYNKPLNDNKYEDILTALRSLSTMGCKIIRFSYPDSNHKELFKKICKESPMPVVADIHFDWKLAIEALKLGADKIRINPGNIGAKWKVEEVVRAAADYNSCIRIGLNGGSLPRAKKGLDNSTVMVETALEYLNDFEKFNFYNTVVSLKDTSVENTYKANVELARAVDYPIHLGVTEAGGIVSAVARSTWALGRLLMEGIGDTIRVSITDELHYEISAAYEILRTVGVENRGVRVVSCPKCNRSTFDSEAFLKEVEMSLLEVEKPLTVAIMGCQVNGPGEAKQADIAITGIADKLFLYKKGKLIKEIEPKDAKAELMKTIEELSNE